MNPVKPMVVAAFPGTGKTEFCKRNEGQASDSDSSAWSWTTKDGKRVRNPDFPQNYIDHIKRLMNSRKPVRWILVSSHKAVRQALTDNQIPFVLAYPQRHLKEDYLWRYQNRGSEQGFVDMLRNHWDEWIRECEQQDCLKIVLRQGQFLTDVLRP